MIGAIIGDIVGSRFEFWGIKTKEFELFTNKNNYTDDTVLTLAIGKAFLECQGNYLDLDQKVKIIVRTLKHRQSLTIQKKGDKTNGVTTNKEFN